jgi:hypothetical protein
MAQPDLTAAAAAASTPHGVYSGLGPSYAGPTTHASGWRRFAATIMFIASAANVMWGVAALAGDRHFHSGELLYGSLSMWGAILLVIAALQLLTGALVLGRHVLGAVLGIGIASISLLVQLMAIGAYPIWSVIVIVIDGLVIYGLAMHGTDS